MAYLTAAYQDFSYGAISGDLQALFDEQYQLSLTETTETRCADPYDANGDGDYQPYNWNILTISLVMRPLSDVITTLMTAEQQTHYDALMQTKGGRQYAGNPFETDWLPNVTSYYGWRVHPISGEKDLHRGIDIAMPEGTEIRSAHDGTVTFAGESGSYGNLAVVEGADGIVTKYAHCEALFVTAGQPVTAGEVIATVGSTGSSTGAHLHLELLIDGQYANPLFFVSFTN
ncbi:MAG: M23 family metallopeptidase, partial [Clostridiales bacterium]|jgi:murein DD-endopeptidase MepM/ murein hydrolase activator NlpD|nr:M23 family metallopeptidase [Clostridiales bacterium]